MDGDERQDIERVNSTHARARLERITRSADPAIERGLTPGMVRAIVFYETGILIGVGGHNDPCTAEVCRYCGACGTGGHGDSCPGGAWARDLTAATEG